MGRKRPLDTRAKYNQSIERWMVAAVFFTSLSVVLLLLDAIVAIAKAILL